MTEEQEKFLKGFIEDERLRGKRETYLQSLKHRTPKLFDFLDEYNISLNMVKLPDALSYQKWLIERITRKGSKYLNISINGFIFSATSFFNYLKREKIVYTNPFKEVRKMREDRKLPRNVLKEKDMYNFLNELSDFNKEKGLKKQIRRYRVSVISELMYSTAMRINEVGKLKVNDIDFERSIVNVIDGKGGKNRVAFLNEYTKNILKIYVAEMREAISNEWNERNKDSLFGIKAGWTEKSVNLVLKEVANSINLPLITSHNFRHAVGFHLLRGGCDIRYIQALLGHSRLKTTEIYTKVDKEDLKRVLDKFHPRKFMRVEDGKINN